MHRLKEKRGFGNYVKLIVDVIYSVAIKFVSVVTSLALCYVPVGEGTSSSVK